MTKAKELSELASAATVTSGNVALSGGLDVDGVTDLDVVDIDGAVNMATTALVTGVLTTTAATVSNGGGQFNGAINVGVDDTGYDVKFFGDTASAYMQWDASTDDLILGGASTLGIGTVSPLRQLHISNTSANSEIAFTAGTSGTSSLLFGDGLTGVDVYKGYLQYQHNGDYMLLASAGATVVRLDSDGLKFGADSAAANALSDYEEGTWTPSFAGVSNTPTYHGIAGTYTKIGRTCTVQMFIQTNQAPTFTTTANTFAINGLPFTVAGSGYTGSQGSMNAQSFSFNGGDNNIGLTGVVSPSVNNSEQMQFQVTASGSVRGIVNNVGAAKGFIIEVTLTYFTSD